MVKTYLFTKSRIVFHNCNKKISFSLKKRGRKRPLDTPKKMIERREREKERERKVEGEI